MEKPSESVGAKRIVYSRLRRGTLHNVRQTPRVRTTVSDYVGTEGAASRIALSKCVFVVVFGYAFDVSDSGIYISPFPCTVTTLRKQSLSVYTAVIMGAANSGGLVIPRRPTNA